MKDVLSVGVLTYERRWEGFMYNVFPLNQNLCAKKPCLNNRKCYMGYTEKKYVCVCPAGYHGENCEKGKQYIDN